MLTLRLLLPGNMRSNELMNTYRFYPSTRTSTALCFGVMALGSVTTSHNLYCSPDVLRTFSGPFSGTTAMSVNDYAQRTLSGTITMTVLRSSHCLDGEVGGEDGTPKRLYKR